MYLLLPSNIFYDKDPESGDNILKKVKEKSQQEHEKKEPAKEPSKEEGGDSLSVCLNSSFSMSIQTLWRWLLWGPKEESSSQAGQNSEREEEKGKEMRRHLRQECQKSHRLFTMRTFHRSTQIEPRTSNQNKSIQCVYFKNGIRIMENSIMENELFLHNRLQKIESKWFELF